MHFRSEPRLGVKDKAALKRGQCNDLLVLLPRAGSVRTHLTLIPAPEEVLQVMTNATLAEARRPGKADFDFIYDQPDPRDYYTTLAHYDYQLPDRVQDTFGRLIEERAKRDRRAPNICDLACSYGINSALLKYRNMTFSDLARRYASPEIQRMGVDELVEADTAFFADRLKDEAPTVYGCDVAAHAVRYAERVGLLDQGWGVNLENQAPDADLQAALEKTDIVFVSAAIGYLTYRTINAVLSRIPHSRRPWFAAFSLRTAPIDPVAHALQNHNLELATLTGRTVRQRRFVDEHEQATAIAKVRERGYVVDGHETDGYWHAALYIGMPADEEPIRMMELLDIPE